MDSGPSCGATAAVARLLSAAERLLGLTLCFHPRPYAYGWPRRWIVHANRACRTLKHGNERTCYRHCSEAVFAICRDEDVRRVTCPFGHTELLCPISSDVGAVGLLYAGPLWCGEGDPPREGLVVPPDERWLADREDLLPAIAGQLGRILAEADGPQASRRQAILRHCCRHLERGVGIDEIAALLEVSAGRAAQVVRDLFGCTLAQLHHSLRLDEARHLLAYTGLPIAEIAMRFGYCDQSHFTKRFRARFGSSPQRYRAAVGDAGERGG